MNWSDIAPWVGKLAPMLGTALGGPLGGAAGMLIGQALGIKDADPKSIADAIKTGTLDADHILALKKAEQDFALQMAEMGYKDQEALAELEFKDRDSARLRESSVKDWTPRILAYGITCGFFGMLYWMMRHDIPSLNNDLLNIMLGSFATAWIQVISYYFGSSASSARKDSLLHQSVPLETK